MTEVIGVITIVITSIMSFILFFSVWFGIMTNIFGFKYRRDANLGLRKDYHINIIENFYNFLDNYENEEKMKEAKYDIKLLSFLYSPLSPKKYRDSIKKNFIIDDDVLIEQFKNWRNIENDFMINKNTSFNEFSIKRNIGFQIENKEDALILIIVLLIYLKTDTLDLIIIDEKYLNVAKYFKHLSLSKKQLKRKVKNNEISKEDAEIIKEIIVEEEEEQAEKINEETNISKESILSKDKENKDKENKDK